MARIRGLELQFNLVKNQVQSMQDCLVAAVHTLLINENLQCIGTGEDFEDNSSESGSELLPKGWNDSQDVYTLRYQSRDKKKQYLVKVVKAAAILHFNLVENEDATSALSANVNKYVNSEFKEYDSAYKDLEALKEAFQKDIVEKVLRPQGPKKAAAKNNSRPSPGHHRPTSVPQPRPVEDFYEDSYGATRGGGGGGRGGFPNVGSSDLDPLGRGQGGMLLDPSSFGVPRPHMPPMGGPRGLPRGAVPPGARFDPFGPAIPGPDRFRPNPDHFRPPDFDDFM